MQNKEDLKYKYYEYSITILEEIVSLLKEIKTLLKG